MDRPLQRVCADLAKLLKVRGTRVEYRGMTAQVEESFLADYGAGSEFDDGENGGWALDSVVWKPCCDCVG